MRICPRPLSPPVEHIRLCAKAEANSAVAKARATFSSSFRLQTRAAPTNWNLPGVNLSQLTYMEQSKTRIPQLD